MARTGNNTRIPSVGAYGGAPTFAADLTEVASNLADLIDPSVATVSALPLSGNWYGRRMRVSADNTEYTWLGSTLGWVIADISSWAAYAPTFTSITASAVNFQWRREGQLIRVRPKFTCTTQGSNNPEFTLPVAAETGYSQFVTLNGVLSRIDSTASSVALIQVALSGTSTTTARMYGWGYAALVAGAIPNGHLVSGEFTYRPAS